jgi:hypothetical protein
LMEWEQVEPGWYTTRPPGAAICAERDGRWHVYVKCVVPPGDAICKTLKEAKAYVEKHYSPKKGE